jgi:NTE family protein
VAGSIAIPGLFRPVIFGDEVLIDGRAVNPLRYDLLFCLADIIVAVDVTFGGRSSKRRAPSPFGSMFGAAQIMQGAITVQKIKLGAPDILARPKVLIPEEAAPQFLDDAAPRNGMMPPSDSEMIAPPITE